MPHQNLEYWIKSEREKRGWDQAALAATLGVKQQTVSRWESGQSHPRRDVIRKLAELFKADASVWLEEADSQIDKPVRSLVKNLPLHQLTAENFELFSRDLIQALHPYADVHRYGSQGHTQEGIDLYAKEGTRVLDYQCKRHQQFGPADVEKVIADTTCVAEHHHLLLSRAASPLARKAIIQYPTWSLWDVEDISARIRSLPMDDALRIVDTYFPGGWRRDFLGVEEPSPWLTPEQFYRPLADRARIFSHGWTLAGRRDDVQALSMFAQQSSKQAIILSGRGGIGKSRLLRAFSESLPQGLKVVFIAPGADVSPSDIEHLPAEGVLISDDAHEYPDLLALLSTLALKRPHLKIVLSTRPYGVTRIQDELIRAGIDVAETIIGLGDLSLDDARALSEEILTSAGGDQQYASRIAEITKDCPLATVVGSRLVAEGRIKPELLNNSDKFREHLLRSFRDVIAGEIGGPKNAAIIRVLLDFVALIQPIDPTDPKFVESASTFLERRPNQIARDLRALEDAGVLLRRRSRLTSRLRIVPDLLADYIRANASYDEKNRRPTGYADEVYAAVSGELAINLLVNLSQLDWRLSAAGAQSEIIAQVWSTLEAEFKSAKILSRTAMLSAIQRVAFYQPARALAFAWLAVSHPTNEVEEIPPELRFGHPSYADVLNKLPLILKYAAYNLEYLIPALDLLKELAKLDRRPLHQTPEHPLRVLANLATIQPGRPLEYVEMVVTHVLSWLPDDDGDAFSPFDVVKATLATEGQEPEFSGITLTLKPYTVRASVVAGLRKQIIDKAIATILTRPAVEAARAVRVIEAALQGPANASPEEAAAWEPGFLELLQQLKDIVTNLKLDPYIAVELRSAVQWHATYSKTATGPAARAVLSAIPTTSSYELSRALADGWGWTFERSAETHRRDEAAFAAWRQALARQLVKEHALDFGTLIHLLEERVVTLDSLKLERHSDVGPFLGTLVEESPAFGEALGEHILTDPLSPLATVFGVIIIALAKDHYDTAISFAEAGMQKANPELHQRVGRALGWGLGGIAIGLREIGLVERLGKSDDIVTKHLIVHVVDRFPKEQKSVALRFLLSIDFATSKQLADEVLGEFGALGLFEVADLDSDQVRDVLTRLVAVDSIDDYNIGNFLGELSLTQPSLVVKLLLDRVERQEAHRTPTDYSPLPHSWSHHPPFRFHETAEYELLLQTVRDWTNVNTKSWYRVHYGPAIFKIVSAGYDDATLRVLEEWITSASQQQLETAAALLREVDQAFVWRNPQFVASVLDRAQRFGDTCYQRVSSPLYASAIHGVRSGTPGQPFPEDIALRNRSQEFMSSLTPGSPAYRFYKALHEHAVAAIERDTYDEDELFED